MVNIAEFIDSTDLTCEKKEDLREHLHNLQVPLSDRCQAAVLQALLQAEGWPASFLLYDKAKVSGALEEPGERSTPTCTVLQLHVLCRFTAHTLICIVATLCVPHCPALLGLS